MGQFFNSVEFEIRKSKADDNYELQLVGAFGPKGNLAVINTWSLGPGGSNNISQTIVEDYDLIGLRVKRQGQVKKAVRRRFTIADLRVNGIATGDNYSLTQAFSELFVRLKTSGSRIASTDVVSVPFDVSRATLGQVADELSLIDLWYWRIVTDLDGRRIGEAAPFGHYRYKIVDASFPMQIAEAKRYNKVRFEYKFHDTLTMNKVVTANDHDFVEGVERVFQLDLEDPPREYVASLFAQRVADYLATHRQAGRGTIGRMLVDYPGMILREDPVAYWRLGEVEEDPTTVADSTENNAEGTITGAMRRKGAPGLLAYDTNKSYEFDGAVSYISVDDANEFSPATMNKFAVEAWIVPDTVSVDQDIVSKVAGSAFEWALGITSSAEAQFTLFQSGGTPYAQATGGTIAVGGVYHIVGVWDGVTISVYVNGVLEGSSISLTGSQTAGTAAINIGRRGDASRFFDGIIDDVSVFANSMSPQQVANHYSAGIGTLFVPPTALFPGDALVLFPHDEMVVNTGNIARREDGRYVEVEFTEGSPILDKWLEGRRRRLNHGYSSAQATLGALSVDEPEVPPNVLLGFRDAGREDGEATFHAVVRWDASIEDIDGNGTAIDRYVVEIRPCHENGNPVGENDNEGGHRRKKIVQVDKDGDTEPDGEKVVFEKIDNPKKWFWQARVRAIDIIGQESEWSEWTPITEDARPVAFGPNHPTNVTCIVDQHKVQVDWEHAATELDDSNDPMLDQGASYFKVKLFKNIGAGWVLYNMKKVKATSAIFTVKRTEGVTFRAEVQAVDRYGNVSAWTTSTDHLGIRPPKMNNPSSEFRGTDNDLRMRVMWQPLGSGNQPSYSDDDINHYVVELQEAGSQGPNFGGNVNRTYRRVDEDADKDDLGRLYLVFEKIDFLKYYRCRVRAVDRAGRKSPWSDWRPNNGGLQADV